MEFIVFRNSCVGAPWEPNIDFYGYAEILDDFLLFLSAYGLSWTGPYDIDENEEIGLSDLLQMLILFGTECN